MYPTIYPAIFIVFTIIIYLSVCYYLNTLKIRNTDIEMDANLVNENFIIKSSKL